MFYAVWCDKHLICRWWCGPCKCSGADNDQNVTGQVWYEQTEVAYFLVVRYWVEKLQGLCLGQNSILLLQLIDCGEYVEGNVCDSFVWGWTRPKTFVGCADVTTTTTTTTTQSLSVTTTTTTTTMLSLCLGCSVIWWSSWLTDYASPWLLHQWTSLSVTTTTTTTTVLSVCLSV